MPAIHMIIIIFFESIVYFGVYAAPDNRPGAIIRPLRPIHQLFTVYQGYLWRAQMVLYMGCIANLPRDQQLPLWAMGGERVGAAPINDAIPPCRLSPGWLEPGHLGNNGSSTVNGYTPAHSRTIVSSWLLFSTEQRYFSLAPRKPPHPEGPTKAQNHPRDQQTTFHRAILNERGKNQQH